MKFTFNSTSIMVPIGAALLACLAGCNSTQPTQKVLPMKPDLVNQDSTQNVPATVVRPKDKRVLAAMTEALPVVQQILSVHQCASAESGLRMLNYYAVPGRDMTKIAPIWYYAFPNNTHLMQYHDAGKCVLVSTIDQWAKPSQNALQFRAIFLGVDSGETASFKYLLKKQEGGVWRLQNFYLYSDDVTDEPRAKAPW